MPCGTNDCGSNSAIISKISCVDASLALGLELDKDGGMKDYPTGCFRFSGVRWTYFNLNPLGTKNLDAALICINGSYHFLAAYAIRIAFYVKYHV